MAWKSGGRRCFASIGRGSVGCLAGGLCSILLIVWPACAADQAAFQYPYDASLKSLAVHINRTPKQPWPGYGVYLGNGYVLTAAHVVGDPLLTRPKVVFGTLSLPAETIRRGYFEKDDLTLLRVDEAQLPIKLRLQHVVLCNQVPPLHARVVVATPESIAYSSLVRPASIPAPMLAKFPTLIGDVASTGNSGSGVFEPKSQCLLGIISRKVSQIHYRVHNGKMVKETHDIAKYFVSSLIMKQALPADVKF